MYITIYLFLYSYNRSESVVYYDCQFCMKVTSATKYVYKLLFLFVLNMLYDRSCFNFHNMNSIILHIC